MTARSTTLEDSAKELARKIAAAAPEAKSISLEVRNISSLAVDEVARVTQTLRTELQERSIHAPTDGAAATRAAVTLSENLKNFIWIAEIGQGDASRVVLVTVPRSFGYGLVSQGMPIALRDEKFWEGSERILDAGIIPGLKGGAWRVLLFPDGVVIQEMGGGVDSKVEISSAQTSTRNPTGGLALFGNSVVVKLEPQVCTVILETRTIAECHSVLAPLSARDPVDLAPLGASLPEKAGRTVIVRNRCGQNQQFLVTGAEDDTQQDSMQLYETQGSRSFPVSNPLNFGGAVVALHAHEADSIATGIVRNLETGNYEAHLLLISCGT